MKFEKPREVDPRECAFKAMENYTGTHTDGQDGSSRLLAYAGSCKYFGFGKSDTVEMIKVMADKYPFPREWTDKQIEKRWDDSSASIGDYLANGNGSTQANGSNGANAKVPVNGNLSASERSAKPKNEADFADMFDDAGDVCRRVVTGLLNGEADRLFDCGSAFTGIEVGPGLMAVIGAPPGRGKTALAMELAYNALANEPDLPVVIASLEMTPQVLVKRHLAGLVGVPYDTIRFNQLTDTQRDQLRDSGSGFVERLSGAKFVKHDFCGIGDLDSWRQVAEKPGLLVLDYLQLFGASGDDARTRSEQTMKMASRFCADGWGVICVSAINRTGYHESSMAAFRDSSAVEYGGSSAYLLNEAANPTDENRTHPVQWLRLECVKNRYGAKKSFDLYFDGPRMAFSSREPVNECEGDFDEWNKSAGEGF